MQQSLVENAIKHGLEPKAEGGRAELNISVSPGGGACATIKVPCEVVTAPASA
jgi:sensor histidine kinase YesM